MNVLVELGDASVNADMPLSLRPPVRRSQLPRASSQSRRRALSAMADTPGGSNRDYNTRHFACTLEPHSCESPAERCILHGTCSPFDTGRGAKSPRHAVQDLDDVRARRCGARMLAG